MSVASAECGLCAWPVLRVDCVHVGHGRPAGTSGRRLRPRDVVFVSLAGERIVFMAPRPLPLGLLSSWPAARDASGRENGRRPSPGEAGGAVASRVLRPPGGADRWQWGGAEAGAGRRGSSLEFGAKGEQEEVQGLTLVVSNPESMAGVHAGARGVDPGGPGTGRQEPEQSPRGRGLDAGRWEQEADERQGRSHTCPRPETRPRARGAHTGHAPVGHSVPFIPSASRAHGHTGPLPSGPRRPAGWATSSSGFSPS